jgi:hypothetical protein
MRIEYQLTSDDLTKMRRHHSRIRPWFIVWFIGVLGCISLLSQAIPGPAAVGGAAAPPSLLRDTVLPLLPWGVVFVGIWFFVFRLLRAQSKRPWLHKPRAARQNPLLPTLAFITLAAVAVPLFIRAVRVQASADPKDSATLNAVFSLIPWLMGMAIIAFVFGRIGGMYRRLWNASPHLHRPFAAEFDDRGLRSIEPLSSHDYQWDYFPGFAETPNLFLIYISPMMIHMIPKRSFAGDVEREQFRELLRRNISEKTHAFPVLPVGLKV